MDNRRHIPEITSLSASAGGPTVEEARPLWSVMLPVRNPRIDQLAEALLGVLDQDPGTLLMQIEVLDDDSQNVAEIGELIDQLGNGRIRFTRNPVALGLAGNWNEAVRRATGQYVHLLHQDDRVLPGFYDRMGRPLANDPSLVGAFCRVSGFNEFGEVTWTPLPEQPSAGRLAGLDILEAQSHRMIVTGVVVRRSSYELLGGYRSDLPYCTDWDFLKRLAVLGPVWYEPAALAHWRQHDAQESARLAASGTDMADRRRSVELSMAFLPPEARGRVRFGALQSSLSYGVEMLHAHIESGAIESARSQARQIMATLDELAISEPWRIGPVQDQDGTISPNEPRAARPSHLNPTSERELRVAQRRIEALEAQVKGWAAAVRTAQSRSAGLNLPPDEHGPSQF